MTARRSPAMLYKFLVAAAMLVALLVGAALFWHNNKVDYNQPGLQFIDLDAFDLQDVQTDNARLAYVDFWASWCITCRESFPWMQQMVERYHSQGLRVVTVNLDQEREKMQMFIDTYGANFPVVLDPSYSLFRTHQLTGLPAAILFDLTGEDPRQLSMHQGFEKNQANRLEEKIVGLLGKL